jgi:hypothetical protein
MSYSVEDTPFAIRLQANLQKAGVRCWFIPRGLKEGDKGFGQVVESIGRQDKLLVVLSEHSLRSWAVMRDVRLAWLAEVQEQQRKIFPIRLVDMVAIEAWEYFDRDIGKDLAVEVRKYFMPDFSRWQEQESYQEGLQRLLKDL